MSNFDPELFMQQTVDQPMETERTLCPPGDYTMMVDDFEAKRAIEQIDFEYKKGPNAGQPGTMYVFNCPCVVQDDKVKADMDQDRVIVYKRITLDVNADGQLSWGKNKNIDLGQLRHAVGQNHAGTWNISHLRGAGPFVGKVEKREGKRKDGTNFEGREVTRVAPLTR